MLFSTSVIIPTLGRDAEVDALLLSLQAQTTPPHEVILVDQNGDGRLDAVVARYAQTLPIQHLKVCLRGLSRARNWGAARATGEVLCFPDDDCELFPDTLARGVELLQKTNSDALFGRAADREGHDAVTPFSRDAGRLSPDDYEGRFVDFSVFVRRATWARFPYDETLGVGAFHGAEEGHDQVLRMLHGGAALFYSPEVRFFHPRKVNSHRTRAEIRRVFTYRCGFARLCLKHRLYAKLGRRLLSVLLYLGYLTLFDRRKARYYQAELLGLLAGIVVP